jgi:hypothetical protein
MTHQIDTNITDAEFNSSISDQHNRAMLKNAHQAITAAEAWPFMQSFRGTSFMLSDDPMVSQITKNMVALGYDGHSGSSFGWTMRCMEFLAKNGKEEFLKQFC